VDDADVRVILTSIGFALSSAVGSTGAAARLRPVERLQLLGTVTLGAAVLAFCLLLVGLWTEMDPRGAEGVWRAFGCVALVGIAGSHACAVLGAERRTDTDAIRLSRGSRSRSPWPTASP
jgi:drug/metabolite transporter (DMT)-like permease